MTSRAQCVRQPALCIGMATLLMLASCGDLAAPSTEVSAGLGGDGESRPTPSRAPLIDHALWEVPDASADPFHDPLLIEECPASAWASEGTWLEVDTNVCSHLSLQQPTLVDISDGDELRWIFWHLELYAPEAAVGRAALAIGDRVIWSYETAIPGPPALIDEGFVADFDAAVGTALTFRVDNHGTNSWRLLEVTAPP